MIKLKCIQPDVDKCVLSCNGKSRTIIPRICAQVESNDINTPKARVFRTDLVIGDTKIL